MPILSYLVAVGATLFCVICYVPSLFGPPGPMVLNTSFQGIEKPAKAPESIPILAVRDGPAPDMAVATLSSAKPTQNDSEAKPETSAVAHKPVSTPKKKVARAARNPIEIPRHTRYVQYWIGNDPGRVY